MNTSENSNYVFREVPKEHWDFIIDNSMNASKVNSDSNKSSMLYSRRNDDLSQCYYIDNDKRHHKNEFYHHKGLNKHQQYQKNKKPDNNSNYIYRNNMSGNTMWDNTINNKKNSNENDKKYEFSQRENFSIDGSFDKIEINKVKNSGKDLNIDSYFFKSMEERNVIKEEEKFDNPQIKENLVEIIISKDIKKELDEIPIYSVDTQTNYNFRSGDEKKNSNYFTSFDIKCIYKINEALNYPKNEPLWYIYHVISKSSFGPISSEHMQEIYLKKNVDGNSDVRLIDIFKLKNKGSFAYFKLKEIENPNFIIDFIEPSNLLKYVEELNLIQKEESERLNKLAGKINEKKEMKNKIPPENIKSKPKQKFVDIEEIFNEPAKKEMINIESNPIQNKNLKKNGKDEINQLQGVKISKESSVIDEEFEDNQNKQKSNAILQKSMNIIKKKPGKKIKGKPVEIDIKTGFYTISQQEKEYEPIYICGDSAEKNK